MDEDTQPAKNASTEEWKAYAIAGGATNDEVEDLSRTELIERYGSADDADGATTGGTDPEDAKAAAYAAGEAMTAEDAPVAVSAGAEDVPPHLRAAAVHRPVTG